MRYEDIREEIVEGKGRRREVEKQHLSRRAANSSIFQVGVKPHHHLHPQKRWAGPPVWRSAPPPALRASSTLPTIFSRDRSYFRISSLPRLLPDPSLSPA